MAKISPTIVQYHQIPNIIKLWSKHHQIVPKYGPKYHYMAQKSLIMGRISQIMVQVSPKMDQISLNITYTIKYDPDIAQI